MRKWYYKIMDLNEDIYKNTNQPKQLWDLLVKEKKDEALSLVKSIKDFSQVTKEGRTLLNVAAGFNNLEILRYLIEEKKIDINTKNPVSGYTALLDAMVDADYSTVDYLVSHGADVNIPSNFGDTPLSRAIERAGGDVIKYLIKHGPNVNIVPKGYKSMSEFAQACSRSEVIPWLKEKP